MDEPAPKAARPRLTKRVVDAATCPPGRKDTLIFDPELKGFGLRVTENGAKVFIFQYRVGAAVRRVVLGTYGVELTADEARGKAEALRGQVRAGADPKAERQAARLAAKAAEEEARQAAKATALTFKVLVERWRDIHLANRRERYREEASRALLVSFAAWSDLPAHRITAAEAVAELDDIAGSRGPAAARSAFAYGRAMYGWALRRQLLAVNPFATIEPPAQIEDRDRVLSDAELAAIWTAAEGRPWPMGAFYRMAILTLQRRQEVAAMRWEELSAGYVTWTIPAARSKNGKAHVVHLAPAARVILASAPRIKGSPLVFTTTGKTPVSGFSEAKNLIDKAIADARRAARQRPHELPSWRFHDFRRTGVTRLAALGFAPHVCDRLLNHVQGSITGVAAIYQRHEFLPERKAAIEAWAKHVTQIAAGDAKDRPPGKVADVVPITSARRRKS